MMKILVLFSCYNRIEKTKKCLYSLSKNNNCSFDYLVFDDGSTDGTTQFLEKCDNVMVIRGDGNSYYSGGMRKAISMAKSLILSDYHYVMFINDDVDFFDNSIDCLVEYEGGKGEIIVGAVCDDKGLFSYGGEKRTSRFRPKFKHVNIDDDDLFCDTSCANCVLIPRTIFQKLPNIDDIYSHAMGDQDYFFVATSKGYLIRSSDFYVGCCNDNEIKGGWRDSSLSTITRIKKKENVKGLPFKQYFYYLNKNYSLLTAVIYSLTPYIRIILRK